MSGYRRPDSRDCHDRRDRGDRRSDSRDRGRSGSGSTSGYGQQQQQSYRERDRYGNEDNNRYSSAGSGGDRNRGQSAGRGSFGGRDFGGGRGGGRGGGGGRGSGNPNMGEINFVRNNLRSHPAMSEETIMRIIAPPHNQRDRSMHLSADPNLPRLEAWRVEDQTIGLPITDNVRANFFRIDPNLLPPVIYHYNVSIFRMHADDSIDTTRDLAKDRDMGSNTAVMKQFLVESSFTGLAYDGKSSLYSIEPLRFTTLTAEGTHESVVLLDGDIRRRFTVIISRATSRTDNKQGPRELQTIDVPITSQAFSHGNVRNQAALQALDIAVLSFARWQLGNNSAQKTTWLVVGNKAFRTDGTTYAFTPWFLGRLGYQASVRCTPSGLVLVSDVSVTCFMRGGPLIDLMALISNCRDADDFYRSGAYEHANVIQKILDLLFNLKIKMIHTGHTKKLKSFSHPATSQESEFRLDENDPNSPMVTVAEYFRIKAQPNGDPRYSHHLPSGQLRYPRLPTVLADKKLLNGRQILVPPELIRVVEGQVRNQLPSDVASQIIKEAAMVPSKRFSFLTTQSESQGLLDAMRHDTTVQTFGLHATSATPMRVKGVILPPPKLQYGNNHIIEPEVKGSWNLAGGVKFAVPAPLPVDRTYLYGLVTVYADRRPHDDRLMEGLRSNLEDESRKVGTPLTLCSRPEMICAHSGNTSDLSAIFEMFKNAGARFIMILLADDFIAGYNRVKLTADRLRVPTQCAKWNNVIKPPKNYHTSLMIKINYKMGGVGHTLARRGSGHGGAGSASATAMMDENDSFQQPPNSISWIFEEPCQFMGIDVNHPEVGKAGDSVLAVTASMDGRLGQYCAHISRCIVGQGKSSKSEPVEGLYEPVSKLLETFSLRNHGDYARNIIIYRDGVADNQFQQVLESEASQIRQAIDERGHSDVRFAIVVCQKRHNTRIVYKDGDGYMNPAVGLCVDGRDFIDGYDATGANDPLGCINAPGMNEFYLNSHAAILGTAKPCKYTLIYDEIGLKMSELQLLIYWTTHLYCRCTRSVSYATPAYYAHWAARRGKCQLSAGASPSELQMLSENWLQEAVPSMYFT